MSVLGHRALIGIVVMALAGGGGGVAGQAEISASAGWVKAPGSGETTAMAFATIQNPSMYEVYFTSATTDVAARVEFRDRKKGLDPAAQVVKFVMVPAYDNLSMDQNGVHLMLLDLKRPLAAGDTVSLTLVTDAGVKVQVPAEVRTQ